MNTKSYVKCQLCNHKHNMSSLLVYHTFVAHLPLERYKLIFLLCVALQSTKRLSQVGSVRLDLTALHPDSSRSIVVRDKENQVPFEVASHLTRPAPPRVIVICQEVSVVSRKSCLLQFVRPCFLLRHWMCRRHK